VISNHKKAIELLGLTAISQTEIDSDNGFGLQDYYGKKARDNFLKTFVAKYREMLGQ